MYIYIYFFLIMKVKKKVTNGIEVHQDTYGSASIKGNAFSCILDGRLKPMA